MRNAVSLEPKDFVNPDLTWKAATKGFRNASRRPRKPAKCLNLAMQWDDKNTKRAEPLVSGLEKLGLSTHGQNSEKIEYVPIKKRRFQLGSSSPPSQIPSSHRGATVSSQPQTSCAQAEYFDHSKNKKRGSLKSWSSDSLPNQGESQGLEFSQNIENACLNGKLSEVTSRKSSYTEDFSGIALLAAAACSNNVIDDAHNIEGARVDEFLTLEGTDSSISATPSERAATCSETDSLSPKDLAHDDNVDCSAVQNKSVVASHNFQQGGKRSTSGKDDRLHWDLNTVMEAWELPPDADVVTQRHGSSECTPENNDGDVHSEKEEKLESCVRHDDQDCAIEQLKHASADMFPTQVIGKDKSFDYSHCSASGPNSSRSISAEKLRKSPTSEVCCTSVMRLGHQIVSVVNSQNGLDTMVSDNAECSIDQSHPKDDCTTTLDLPSYDTVQTEQVSTVTCQISDAECSVRKLGEIGVIHPSPEHVQLSSLGNTLGEGQPILAVDVEKKQDEVQPVIAVNVEKKRDEEALAEDTTTCSSLPVDSKDLKELMAKSEECFGKVHVEEPVEDRYGFDISHGNHHLPVNAEKTPEIQVGYESPFEDGELRESLAYSWEDEVEGRTEYVGCDSGNRKNDDCDAAKNCASGIGSGSCHDDNDGFVAAMECERIEALKESSPSASSKRCSGQDRFSGGCECSSDGIDDGNNDNMQNLLVSSSKPEFDVKDSTVEAGSTVDGKKLSSRIEGPSWSDDLLKKKDDLYVRRDRSSCHPFSRAGRRIDSEKYLGRDKSNMQMQDDGKRNIRQEDSPASYLDSRNHYRSAYPQDARHPGRRSVANSSVKINNRSTYHDQRPFGNNSLKGVFLPLGRRRSPDDSDDGYSVGRRMLGTVDNSHMRNRGRSGIYWHGVNGGPREGYDVPISDDSASSLARLPRNLSRRERSISPMPRRGAGFSRPRRNSRSRSRSRPAKPWHWQRERERDCHVGCFRRSPDFWSEARRETIRMPSQKFNFAADYDVPMSPRGRCFSPEYRTRWVDDENCTVDPFEESKLSDKFFGRIQRFESGGSSGRGKFNDGLRFMTRPGRLRELSGGVGRGYQYNENGSGRSKYRNNCGPIHQMRRCGSSDRVRRFRYDMEDCFEAHDTQNEDSYIRGTGRTEIKRSSTKEERRTFKYNKGRTHAIGPRLSGSGDEDRNEDASPSRG